MAGGTAFEGALSQRPRQEVTGQADLCLDVCLEPVASVPLHRPGDSLDIFR